MRSKRGRTRDDVDPASPREPLRFLVSESNFAISIGMTTQFVRLCGEKKNKNTPPSHRAVGRHRLPHSRSDRMPVRTSEVARSRR